MIGHFAWVACTDGFGDPAYRMALTVHGTLLPGPLLIAEVAAADRIGLPSETAGGQGITPMRPPWALGRRANRRPEPARAVPRRGAETLRGLTAGPHEGNSGEPSRDAYDNHTYRSPHAQSGSALSLLPSP